MFSVPILTVKAYHKITSDEPSTNAKEELKPQSKKRGLLNTCSDKNANKLYLTRL
jgi:hypothetical protein